LARVNVAQLCSCTGAEPERVAAIRARASRRGATLLTLCGPNKKEAQTNTTRRRSDDGLCCHTARGLESTSILSRHCGHDEGMMKDGPARTVVGLHGLCETPHVGPRGR
jgi:hypothetical protein